MKNWINVISTKLSITRAEVIIIACLFGFALGGFFFKTSLPFQDAKELIKQKEKAYFTGSQADSIIEAEEKAYQKIVDLQFNLINSKDSNKNPVKHSSEKLNLNLATYQDLLEIPGIGPVMADRLIRFRTYKGGRLKSFNQLLEVKGINQSRLTTLKEYLKLSNPAHE